MSGLDHGLLNVPLAKRGNIDVQIDRYKAEQSRLADAEAYERFHRVRRQKASIKTILALLPDVRVVELAAPLGKRKPSSARAALYQAATSNLEVWQNALMRELGESPAACCGSVPCSRLDGPCCDMAGRCAKCRSRYPGCNCNPEEWMGPQ